MPPTSFRKILVSVKFVSAILGPEMAAPILWTPGKNAFFLQEKLHVRKIPPFWGGFWGGGSADFIFMGARIFLKETTKKSKDSFLLRTPAIPGKEEQNAQKSKGRGGFSESLQRKYQRCTSQIPCIVIDLPLFRSVIAAMAPLVFSALPSLRLLTSRTSPLGLCGGSQKGGFQKGGFGGCSPRTKTGTRVHSPKPPFWKPPFYLPVKAFLVLTKGWFPKGWFRRMFPRNENRNEGTFAKTTLLGNRPFISQ